METVTHKPVTTVAHDFTLQPGVPLIRVASETCNNGSTTLELTQGQFTKGYANKMMQHWHVPVSAQTVGGGSASVLVDGKASLVVPGCGPVVVNAGQTGYFRTLYSPQAFAALSADYGKLAPIDQLGLLDDTSALGLAGLQPASGVLDLIKATPVDADPVVWGNITQELDSLNRYYRDGDAGQAAFRAFAIAKLEPVFKQVGWEAKAGEPATVAILRERIIYTLSNLGDRNVIAEAQRRFAAQATDPSAVPVALRKVITAVVAYNADATAWEELHKRAQAEQTPLVKDTLYALLASAKDKDLAKRSLDLALTSEPGATNSANMVSTVAQQHPELAFDFAVAHREQMNQLIDATSRSEYYPRLIGSSLDSASIEKMHAFEQAYIAPTSRRVADSAVATMQYRIGVHKDRLPAIDTWLKNNG